MADGTSRRLTAAEGRRFAFVVAGGFAALAGVAYLRSRPSTMLVLAAIAVPLAVAGLAAPSRLGPVQRGWMALGVALSRITAPLFYSALYWLVLTPIGIVRRTVGRSPLARDAHTTSFWIVRPPQDEEVARRRMERQF